MTAELARKASMVEACNESGIQQARSWSGWLRVATIVAGISTTTAAGAEEARTPPNRASVISVTGVERRGERRHALLKPNWINYQDCREGATDSLVFKLAISGGKSQTVEAWVSRGGIDCRNARNRADGVSCMELSGLSSANGSPQVEITVAELLSMFGVVSGCGETSTSRRPVPLSFYFLVNPDRTGVTADHAVWSDGGFDLWGPSPPTRLGVLAGDQELEVQFSGNPRDKTDLGGYHVYVDKGELVGGDGSTTTSRGEHVFNCGSDAVRLSCKPESSALVPGTVPDEETHAPYRQSGSFAPTAAEGTISRLENHEAYVIAMAAYDKVGNLSPLSDLACGVPQEMMTFLRAYDCGGGLDERGCGFCSIGGGEGGSWAALASGAHLVVGFAARRRGRERARRGR